MTVTDLIDEHRAVVREIDALTAETTAGPVVPPKRLRELLAREQELSDLLAEQRRARAEEARRDALDDARETRHGMEAWLS